MIYCDIYDVLVCWPNSSSKITISVESCGICSEITLTKNDAKLRKITRHYTLSASNYSEKLH